MDEFVNFVNQSITSKSTLRHIAVEDIRSWTNKELFRHAPEYYHDDFKIVLALLQVEREAQLRYSSTSPLEQKFPVYKTRSPDLKEVSQKGVVQVVTCVSSNFSEEQRIVQALKDTGLIASAGRVAVNFYPFSSKPVQIPSDGVEAREGNMLILEADGSEGINPNSVITQIGTREFTKDDAFFKNICNLGSLWGHELLPGIEHLVSPEIAEQMRSAALLKRKQFAKSVYTFPVFMPIMKIGGIPALDYFHKKRKERHYIKQHPTKLAL